MLKWRVFLSQVLVFGLKFRVFSCFSGSLFWVSKHAVIKKEVERRVNGNGFQWKQKSLKASDVGVG